MKVSALACFCFVMGMETVDCLSLQAPLRKVSVALSSAAVAEQDFDAVAETPENKKDDSPMSSLSLHEIKDQLLDLLPRMTGTEEEFRSVENYVNALEENYAPPQTLGFLNLAMGGEWQLLFSTNLSGGPRPTFRLKELVQSIQPKQLEGSVVNTAQWDLSQGEDGVFDCSGTFSAECSYTINQGARMLMELDDHKIELARGSTVPQDVPALVGKIHSCMPKELFDPNDHAVDTTYLDGDLRIVRLAGPKFEAVRDIFIRVGSMEINPVAEDE